MDCGSTDEDESLLCAAQKEKYDPDYFKCTDGTSIPDRWFCDKEKDCPDGSDESVSIWFFSLFSVIDLSFQEEKISIYISILHFDLKLQQNCTQSTIDLNRSHALLLVGQQHLIRNVSLEHTDLWLTVENVNSTESLTVFDYSYKTGEIFWCDVAEQRIFKTTIDDDDGYNRETIRRLANNVTINGLAVDWIYYHIYYTECMVLQKK